MSDVYDPVVQEQGVRYLTGQHVVGRLLAGAVSEGVADERRLCRPSPSACYRHSGAGRHELGQPYESYESRD